MPFEFPDNSRNSDQIVQTAVRCGRLYLSRYPQYIRQKLESDLDELALRVRDRFAKNYPGIQSVGLINKVMRNLIIDLQRAYESREKNQIAFPENFDFADTRAEQQATGLTWQRLMTRYRTALKQFRQETSDQLSAESEQAKSSTAKLEQLQNRLDLLDWLGSRFESFGEQLEMQQKDIVLTFHRSEATISAELKVIRLLLRTRVLMHTDSTHVIACLPLPPDSSDGYSDAYKSWQCYDGKNRDVTLEEGGLLTVARVSEPSREIADSALQHSEVVRGTVLVGWQHQQLTPGQPNLVNVTCQNTTAAGDDHRSFSSGDDVWGLPIALQPNGPASGSRANLNLHYSGRHSKIENHHGGRQSVTTVPHLTVRCSLLID